MEKKNDIPSCDILSCCIFNVHIYIMGIFLVASSLKLANEYLNIYIVYLIQMCFNENMVSGLKEGHYKCAFDVTFFVTS